MQVNLGQSVLGFTAAGAAIVRQFASAATMAVGDPFWKYGGSCYTGRLARGRKRCGDTEICCAPLGLGPLEGALIPDLTVLDHPSSLAQDLPQRVVDSGTPGLHKAFFVPHVLEEID